MRGMGCHRDKRAVTLPLAMALAVGMAVAASLASCSDAPTTTTYTSLYARFTFTPVSSMTQLYTSCNSQGEWCTITLNRGKFYFTNLSSTGEAPQTALSGYDGFYMGLSGFIVGLPNMPEPGADYPVVTCYELACSNCYEERNTTIPLSLQTGGYAHCSRCDLTYNLNNQGIVSDKGENPYGYSNLRSLFRYRCYYGGDTFTISNS